MQTNFLYPLKIAVRPEDLAWRWALAIFTLSFLVPVWYLPFFLTVLIFVLGLTWLRFVWDSQSIIRKAVFLVGSGPDEWYLQMNSGDLDYVELKSVETFGMFVILKLKRFGSSSYLIQTKSRIAEDQLHKLNLLSLNMVVR